MRNDIEALLDDLDSALTSARKAAQELDGRKRAVKHVRTCIFAAKDILNKVERKVEMICDEDNEGE